MLRFDFVTRLVLIFIFSLIMLQILMVVLFYSDRGQATGDSFRLPLPDQVAAMVELLEAAPPESRELAMRAVNTPRFNVRVIDTAAGAAPPGWQRSGYAERVLRRYLAALGSQQVTVLLKPVVPSWLFPGIMAFILPGSSAIYIEMTTGQTLVVESQSVLTISLFGLDLLQKSGERLLR